MALFSWKWWLKRITNLSRQDGRRARGSEGDRRRRPHLEPLEERRLLAVFPVSNTLDSGPGSLRQALLDANANAGADEIRFSIGSGVQTIRPTSVLPTITDAVLIDGTTQPGFAGRPLIELDGSLAGEASGLGITGASSTVRGLVINRFRHFGILLSGSGAVGNVLQGNYVGTDGTGTTRLENTDGIVVTNGAARNLIGGPTEAARNVLSGNRGVGVSVSGNNGSTHDNLVWGNFIGTDPTGTAAVLNAGGVHVFDAVNNVVVGNLIAGNRTYGIYIQAFRGRTSGMVVFGNWIGTNVTGAAALANGGDGILVRGATDTVIDGNVISGNRGSGVRIERADSQGNVVQGNYIGTDYTGTVGLGNDFDGVQVTDGSSNNMIGGASAGNLIAFNGQKGIRIGNHAGDLSVNNAIRGNSIHSNSSLGIDHSGDGPTPDDAADVDDGPNRLQNAPTLLAAVRVADSVTLLGYVYSTPSTTFSIEFFANAYPDATGYGQGERFFGSADVTTDADGLVILAITLTGAVNPGEFVTATATDPAGNTSEFSLVTAVTEGGGSPGGPSAAGGLVLTNLTARHNAESSLGDEHRRTGAVAAFFVSGSFFHLGDGTWLHVAWTRSKAGESQSEVNRNKLRSAPWSWGPLTEQFVEFC